MWPGRICLDGTNRAAELKSQHDEGEAFLRHGQLDSKFSFDRHHLDGPTKPFIRCRSVFPTSVQVKNPRFAVFHPSRTNEAPAAI